MSFYKCLYICLFIFDITCLPASPFYYSFHIHYVIILENPLNVNYYNMYKKICEYIGMYIINYLLIRIF